MPSLVGTVASFDEVQVILECGDQRRPEAANLVNVGNTGYILQERTTPKGLLVTQEHREIDIKLVDGILDEKAFKQAK